MSRLDISADAFSPGRWTLRSEDPAALAATCDAVVQVLGLEGEALAAWALHHDEQTALAEQAYAEERRELGPQAQMRIVELPRPPRHNVVWIDRIHLVTWAARPTSGSRLLGLYVGSRGRLVVAMHHPSVTAPVAETIGSLPGADDGAWESPDFIANCRLVVSYDEASRDSIEVRAPQSMAHPVADALSRLAAMVASW